MKERPILFSGEMVSAILEGRKTQTRRVMKLPEWTVVVAKNSEGWAAYNSTEEYDPFSLDDKCQSIRCPYGFPGDRLWVRETDWHEVLQGQENAAFDDGELRSRWDAGTGKVFHIPKWKPSAPAWRHRPSIHMPRWASRITLEVVSVRVERLQDISENDAIAEGVTPTYQTAELEDKGDGPRFWQRPRKAFELLWDSLAKPGEKWADNPWVWVIEFKRIGGEE